MDKNFTTQKHQKGFTLIELSIVMIIIGIALVGAIEVYKIYNEKQKVERMNLLMTDINQYLKNFPNLIDPATATPDPEASAPYGRMPCPAPLNGEGAGNDFDTENCATATRVRVAGKGDVLIGKLPTATLGIRNDYMKDIHGNYLLYAVSADATNPDTYGARIGAITVLERGIDRNVGSPTFGNIVNLETHENVQFTVVSFGEGGEGAFAYDGTRISDCGTGRDAENCDGDANFVHSLKSDRTDNGEYYDDMMLFEAYTVNIARNQEPVMCEQVTGEYFYETCPSGWEKVDGFNGVYVSSSGSSSQKILNGPKEIVQFPDGTYTFKSITSFPQEPLASSASKTIFCKKNETNTDTTKCFTEKVTMPVGTRNCPSGYYPVGSKSYTTGGTSSDSFQSGGSVPVCGKI